MNGSTHRRRPKRLRRLKLAEDRGFTLPELLISVVILGIITGAIGAAVIVALRSQDRPARVLGPSNDANLVASYFTADVESASTSNVAPGALSGCADPLPADTVNVVALAWTDNAPSPAVKRSVAYQYNAGAATLTRVSCITAQAANVITVARNVRSAGATVDTDKGSIRLDLTSLAADAAAGDPPFAFSLHAFSRLAGSGSGGGSGGGSGADQLPDGQIAGTVNIYATADGSGAATPAIGAALTLAEGAATVASATTGTDGKYYFGTLPDGTYTLTLTLAGHAATSAGPFVRIVVLPAPGGATVNFGAWVPVSSISGLVRKDDVAASPIPGATVTLTGPANLTATTPLAGTYSFPNLALGTYTVTVTTPGGYVPVSGGTCAVTLVDATPQTCADAIFHALASDISGTVKIDVDNNGTGDTNQAGVLVTLTGGPGPITLTATTGAAGTFTFPGLAPGTYTITQTVPGGYVAVVPPGATITRTLDGIAVAPTVGFVNRLVGPPPCALATPHLDLIVERVANGANAGRPKNNEVINLHMDRACTPPVTFRFLAPGPGHLGGPPVLTTVTATGNAAFNYVSSDLSNAIPGNPAWAAGVARVEVWENGTRLVGTIDVTVT